MKKPLLLMKKPLLQLLCLLSIVVGQSQTFNDGVLEYTVTDVANNFVSVNKYDNTCPTGAFTIPETITDGGTTYTIMSIEMEAFRGCSGITSLILPEGLPSVGDSAFYACDGITDVTFPDSLVKIERAAFKFCKALTSVSLPANLTTIEDYAFDTCDDLASVSFPDGLESIGRAAFRDCPITSLSLPESITTITSHAFNGCTDLTSVTVNWSSPLSITPNVFQGVTIASIPLTVSAGSLNSYQAAPVWQDFGSITLSASDFDTVSAVRLYPNPASTFIRIELDDFSDHTKTTIYNSIGQLVSAEYNTKINVSNYPRGLYFAEIETLKGKITKKFVLK